MHWVYKLAQWDGYHWEIRHDVLHQDSNYEIVVDFVYDYAEALDHVAKGKGAVGCGGTFTMTVTREGHEPVVHTLKLHQTTRALFSLDETLDIGHDTGTPIRDSHTDKMPFAFNGTLQPVVIELFEPDLPEHIKARLGNEAFEARAEAVLATE